MAFGASNDDINVVVNLVTAQAERLAEEFTKGLQEGMRDAAREVDKLETEIKQVGSASKNVAVQAKQSFGEMTAAVGRLTAAVAATVGAFAGMRKIINDGDAFDDVSAAFLENAQAAGVLAETIRNNLSQALNGAVSDYQLFIIANKAFKAGIPTEAFDELAFAARRFAESTGGDATQALNEMIQAITIGSERGLKNFKLNVQDGVIVLDKLTQGTLEQANSSRSAADVLNEFTTGLANVYGRITQAISNSGAYVSVLEKLAKVVLSVANVLADAYIGAITLVNRYVQMASDELDNYIRGFSVLLELASQVSRGEMPSLGKAIGTVAGQMKVMARETEKTDKVLIRVKDSASEAGGAAKKASEDIRKSIDDLSKETTERIEKAFGFKSILEQKIEKEVAAAFQAFSGNTPALVSALDKIQKDILSGILDPDAAKKAADTFMKAIEENLKPAEAPQSSSGSIFGISFDGLDEQLAGAMQSAIVEALQLTQQAIDGGLGRDDVASIAGSIGSAISVALGDPSGQSGQIVGSIIGSIAAQFGKDNAGTKARKSADAFFAEIFDADRLSIVVNGEMARLRDLVFRGDTLFGGMTDFGSGQFDDAFAQQTAQVQGAFNAVGSAFEQLLGVTDDISGQIAAVLFNNVGESLQNLQILVQTTGRSFEELGDAIIQSFFNGNLTIQEAYDSLVQLQQLFEVGIPGAIGAVDQAISNFQAALEDGRGSRMLIDSLRDIGAEGREVGRSLQSVAQQVGTSLGFSTNQVAQLFEAMRVVGIQSVQQLAEASTAQLVALAENIRRIREGVAGIVGAPTDPTATSPQPSNFATPTPRAPSSSGGGSRSTSNAASRAEADAKRRREELFKLLTTSSQYSKILESLNAQTISQAQASRQIAELYAEIDQATRGLAQAEKAYREALEKRGKKQSEIAKLAQRVEEAQKKVDELTDKAKKAGQTPKFDVSGALKLVSSVNELAIVARAAGVNAEALTKTLTEGFLRGRLSITEYRNELQKLEETFSEGIPGAVGDVRGALNNLFEGGKSGGLFSVDAFKDIFAEFEELFGVGSSERRRSQFQQLTNEFNEARDALQSAIAGGATPAAIDALRQQFAAASKALEDFKNTSDKADFADLRSELEKSLSPEQVNAFFGALEKEGINSFDQIKQAGPDAITKILASLDQLGFGFGETTDRVKGLIDNLDKANIAQTNGVDVLGKALDVIKGFNSDTIAGSFDTMADKISGTLDLLSQLGGNTFNNDVVLNVRTEGSSGALGLVDSLFGDGGGSSDGVTGGNPGLSPAEQAEFDRLSAARRRGRLSRTDRARFEALRRKRRGG